MSESAARPTRTERLEWEYSVSPDAAQAHLARWLAWYWQHRGNPLGRIRRTQAGRRNAEAGKTAAGAVRVGDVR